MAIALPESKCVVLTDLDGHEKKLRYEFESLNYRTAAFFSSMHGDGEVTVSNDYVYELDLPDPLKPTR